MKPLSILYWDIGQFISQKTQHEFHHDFRIPHKTHRQRNPAKKLDELYDAADENQNSQQC